MSATLRAKHLKFFTLPVLPSSILSPKKMFASETSAVVKSVGAEENLISNTNLNQKVDLLTLVRVREGKFFEYPKYTAVDCTLPELIEEEEEFSPGKFPGRHTNAT